MKTDKEIADEVRVSAVRRVRFALVSAIEDTGISAEELFAGALLQVRKHFEEQRSNEARLKNIAAKLDQLEKR